VECKKSDIGPEKRKRFMKAEVMNDKRKKERRERYAE
jgi:hypothetical protein